ncbi:MAG: Fe-S cluster assembly transcriptional regulator IscR [Pseudohongiellaceae bacterium]|jgi:Rrf2 family iron-sulfur cluster assembly transcriptional regulator
MRLTTKGRYAVTAMLDLALHEDQGPISLADISKRQTISLSYLEQLFAKLRKGALVNSVRGPGGGYELQRASAAIYIAEIIDAVNESVDTTRCRGAGDCQGGETCLTHYLWEDLSDQIHRFLEGISLANLVAKHEIKAIAEQQDRKYLIASENGNAVADDDPLGTITAPPGRH